MTVVAAIDCGTNTIKLMVADLPDGPVLEREVRMVRLGQDVDRTGRLADEALARTFAAVEEYAATIGRHPVERIRFWEVFGNLKWAVICARQANDHRTGLRRSHELASLGRRICEPEWDMLELIA